MITYNGNTKSLIGYKRNITKVIKLIAEDNKQNIEQIDYIFVSDDELLKINISALNHDFYTDIITFDYTDSNSGIEAEIYISIDRIEENAKKYNEVFHVELLRVIFHGVLHCVGYKDKSKTDSEIMRKQENKYINIYKKMFHVEQS